MNTNEIVTASAWQETDDEDRALRHAIILTASTCAATVCNLCKASLNEETFGDDIKSIGPAHRLDNWLTYQHSAEYVDGRQYYWECEADEMWKALE